MPIQAVLAEEYGSIICKIHGDQKDPAHKAQQIIKPIFHNRQFGSAEPTSLVHTGSFAISLARCTIRLLCAYSKTIKEMKILKTKGVVANRIMFRIALSN